MMKKLLISLLFLSSSCAQRMVAPLPNIEAKDEKLRISEYEKYALSHQTHQEVLLEHIEMNKESYDLDTTKYMFDFVNPDIYPQLASATWGQYLGLFSLLPLFFFADKTINEQANLTNLSLLTLSAAGFAYGISVEKEKNNKLIDKYNQQLKIKLDLIQLPLD